ncbi:MULTISPECIES: methyltransferase [unclassified Nocardiopsis]|uniref:methyltransferase n=1 Tax=Nocardiopsis TaxID=2013 RepID=UPI00387AF1CA
MTQSPEASVRIHELAYGLALTGALLAAVRLGVAETLDGESAPVEEIASTVGADPDALHQLLRALALHGVFTEVSDRVYAHTPMSRTLRQDLPGNRSGMVRLAGAPFAWRMWERLDESVRTGRSVLPGLYGKDLYDHLAEDDPVSGEIFDLAMSRSSQAASAALARTVDLSGAATVADIGGGTGTLLRSLLLAHPDLRGVLFDLPRVVARAEPDLSGDGALADRCEVIAGDALVDLSVKADVYVFKGVLHMWDDEAVVGVLRRVVAAAPFDARVVLLEQVLDRTASRRAGALMDLLMLVSQGGRERTEAEFADVLGRAGLKVRRTVPAGPTHHMIEAVLA